LRESEKRREKKRRISDLVASNLLARAVTTDIDTATSSLGLEDSLDVESDLDVETSDRIDLSTVVGGSLVDIGLDIDSEAPSSIDLLDSSTDIDKELTVSLIAALAGPSKVPEELNSGHAINVGESPAERSPLGILEALKIHPVNILGDCTSPVALVVDDGLTSLDDIPDSLADGNDLVNVNLVLGRSDIARSIDVRNNSDMVRGHALGKTEGVRAVLLSKGKDGNKKSDKKSAHYETKDFIKQ